MKMKYTAAFAAAVTAVVAQAQQPLSKEIIVNREIEPAQRTAVRPTSVAPSIVAPTMKMPDLRAAEYTGLGRLRHVMPLLEPAPWNDTLAVQPFRGYAAVGYLPAFNLAASAGYDLLRTARHNAGVWMQYNGASWRQHSSQIAGYNGDDARIQDRYNNFRIGLDGDFGFSGGRLTASAGFMADARRLPNIAEDYDRTATDFGLRVNWDGKAGKNLYRIGANVGNFGYGKNLPVAKMAAFNDPAHTDPRADKSISETTFGFDLGYRRLWKSHSWGIDVNADLQSISRDGTFAPGLVSDAAGTVDYPAMLYYYSSGGVTRGFVRVRPSYRLNLDKVNLELGINLPIGVGEGNDTYLMPDVRAEYAPSQMFALWTQVKGDAVSNTLAQMWQVNPWLQGNVSYRHSSYFDWTLGINVGPVAGFSAELWGGLSNADNWYGNGIVFAGDTRGLDLHPGSEAYRTTPAFDIMEVRDFDGVHGGLRLTYNWRDIVKVSASAEIASHDAGDGGYWQWRDRAQSVIGATLTVKPISPLQINLDWQWRTGRRANMYTAQQYALTDVLLNFAYWDITTVSLRNVSNLHFRADYALTPVFTIFADLDNLLCRRWNITPQIQSPGTIHGLLGVTLQF